jgi:hypothetical protein
MNEVRLVKLQFHFPQNIFISFKEDEKGKAILVTGLGGE